MASTTDILAVEKSTQQQQPQPQPHHHQQQQQTLKCPRCDSSNTKFCYYNNYSLSQPRYFCKACKRYWTRGGTLRNVPVGGGCRKNKRVKKLSSSSGATTAIDSSPSSSSAPSVTTNPSSVINHSSQMDHMNPALFYGLHSDLSFPRFNSNSRVHTSQVFDYDLDHHPQPQVNGLAFSSTGLMGNDSHEVAAKSLLSNHPLSPIFGSLNSTNISSSVSPSASNSPNMASLILSNLQQHQKFIHGGDLRDHNNTQGANSFHGFSPYEQDHMQMQGNNQMEYMGGISSSDPNSIFWTATGVGANWLDATNIGSSSVPSLI